MAEPGRNNLRRRSLSVVLRLLSSLGRHGWPERSPSAVAHCGNFHGCPALEVRNASLKLGQACLWQGAFPGGLPQSYAEACAGERFLSPAMVDPPAPYCGFASEAGVAWLAKLNALTSHCITVVYTVITGGYDPLKPVPGGPQPGLCLIGLVDHVTAQKQTHAARQIGWTLYELPDPTPWPSSPARTSHSLRSMAMRMFPAAEHTIYTDGKVVLLKPPAQIMAEVREATSAPYVVIEHPWSLSQMNEFTFAMARVRYQRRAHVHEDVADIKRQQKFYCKEGACNNQAGMLDATMVIQQRIPRLNFPTGRAEPDARTAIRWIECAWFNDMAMFSHRVQLSFFYAVDALGARRQVFVMPRKMWQKKLFEVAQHKYGDISDNASAPILMGRKGNGQRAVLPPAALSARYSSGPG